MTIRLQNLLIIPPIFLMLGLAVGFLADRAAREEILWGLQEESTAVAVTVAEMTGGDMVDRLTAGDSVAAHRLADDLDEVARHGQVESVMIYSRLKDGTVMAWHRDSTAVALEDGLWKKDVKQLRSQAVIGEPGAWGPYPEALVAAAPVYPSAGGAEPRGAVAVVIDASRLVSVTHDLRRDFIILVLLVTGIGIAAALFLSMSIGRQVRELGRLGATVASGEYRVQVQVSGVKEVQDLSNTLGTMASILSDVLSRGRRALLVGDPFQLGQGMPSAYREARIVDAPLPAGMEVGVSVIGKVSPGCFHGWTETAAHAVFWVGQVATGDTLDLVVAAATANRAMAQGLRKDAPDAVAAEVAELFELTSMQVAWFERPPRDGSEVRVVAGSGTPLRKGGYHVLHSFRSEEMDALSGSLSLFKDLSVEQAAREIPLSFPQSFSGVILLIRPSRPPSEEASS